MREGTTVLMGGFGLGTLLFVVFLVLHLTNHIDWAWYWVAAPLWIPFALVLLIVGVVFVFGALDRASVSRNHWKSMCK